MNEPDTEDEQNLADNSATVVTPLAGSGDGPSVAPSTDDPDPVDRDRRLE